MAATIAGSGGGGENAKHTAITPTENREAMAAGILELFKPAVQEVDERVRLVRYVFCYNYMSHSCHNFPLIFILPKRIPFLLN